MAVKIPLKKYIQRAKQYDAIIRRHDAGVLVEDAWGGSKYFENHTDAFQYAIDNFNSVFVKKGTYDITQIFIDNKQGFTLVFERGSVLNVTDEDAQMFDHPNPDMPIKLMPTIAIRYSRDVYIGGVKIVDSGAFRGLKVYRDGVTAIDSENVIISDVAVENVAGNAIRITSSGTYDLDNPSLSDLKTKHIHITNCVIDSTKSYQESDKLVKGFGVEIEWSENVVIDKCVVKNTEESPIRTHYARSVRVINSAIYDWTYGDAVDIFRSDHVVVSNNRAVSRHPVYAVSIYDYVSNIITENNYLETTAEHQVFLGSSTENTNNPTEDIVIAKNKINGGMRIIHSNLKNVIIKNNVIGKKLYIAPQSPDHENITIEGNTFLLKTSEVVFIANGGEYIIRNNKFFNRIYANKVKKLVVEDNEFTSDGSSYAVALYINGNVSFTRFVNNYVHDMTYNGIVVRATYGVNGVVEIINNVFERTALLSTGSSIVDVDPDSASYVYVYGNVFKETNGVATIRLYSPGVVTENIVDKRIAYNPSIATVKRNIGHATENSGVVTIPSGSTRATVNHGLAAMPNKILITPYGNIRIWVENITSTSFYVVTDTAPETDVQVAWYAEV